ncbi:MAG TPA: choice-of-anchor Q domain-containing protein, partial [Promineifilum sp.]|nr:choice-of-anchor Q domain-containing protein [Promineifilum sp.]
MAEDNPQESAVSGERAWLAALLLRRQSRLMPRFALAMARLRSLSRGQRRRLQRRAAASLAGAALVLAIGAANFGPLGAGVAQAATISVANGEIAVNDNGVCSLIEAIINAEDGAQTHDDCLAGTAGADTIDLPAGGAFTFSTPYVYAAGNNGLPAIDTAITIDGNGATLDLGGPTIPIRLAQVNPTGDLTINATTIRNGLMSDGIYGGGALRVDGGTLTIDGSTLSDNITTAYGGAVFARNDATLTITNSTLSGNRAFRGGAVMGRNSAVTLTDSAVDGNVAKRSGGGIQVEDGRLTLTGGTVNDNGWEPGQIGVVGYVDYAGGVYADGATVSITGTEIDGNYGGYIGGGVLLADVTGATITGATITGNTADTGGGVAWGRASDGIPFPTTGVIRDSLIDGNTADIGGGAALILGELAIEQTTVSNNTALDGYGYGSGGGVANLGGDLTITQSALTGNESDYGGGLFAYSYFGGDSTVVTNTTLSGNSASKNGGGVALDRQPEATFNNVTISDNEAADGGGLAATNPPAAGGLGSVTLNRTLIAGNRASATGDEVLVDDVTVTANNYNLFGHSGITNGNAFNSFTPGATDITATSDGTTPTALAGILAALANNGGPTTPPTKTHALVSNSPALDRAPNAACLAPSPTDGVDQRDVARNQNGTGAAGPNECDVGAYEYVAAP